MNIKSHLRRLGKARCLTQAVMDGELVELNSHLRWDMPVG